METEVQKGEPTRADTCILTCMLDNNACRLGFIFFLN